MKNSELIKLVAKQTNMSQSKTKETITAFCSVLNTLDTVGESIVIPNFGTFKIKERKARNGHNPFIGEKIIIPSSINLTFKQSPTQKAQLNK